MQTQPQSSTENHFSQFHFNVFAPNLDLLRLKTGTGTKASALRLGVGILCQLPDAVLARWARYGMSAEEVALFSNADYQIEPRSGEKLPSENIEQAFNQTPVEDLTEEEAPIETREAAQPEANTASVSEVPKVEELVEEVDQGEAIEEAPEALAVETLPEWARLPFLSAKIMRPDFGVGHYSERTLVALALIYLLSFTPRGCYQTRELYLRCHLTDPTGLPFADEIDATQTEFVALMLLEAGENPLSEEQIE